MTMIATRQIDTVRAVPSRGGGGWDGPGFSASHMTAAQQSVATLPDRNCDDRAARLAALRRYAAHAGFADTDATAAALLARVDALEAWRIASDPEGCFDVAAQLEAAGRFPLTVVPGAAPAFEPGGFQEMILFIEELPW